jgi:hypothetical protein
MEIGLSVTYKENIGVIDAIEIRDDVVYINIFFEGVEVVTGVLYTDCDPV